MATMDNVLSKIAKLMELGKSPNEHEAMQAMAKAQRLMTEYSINEADVDNAKAGLGNDFIKQEVSMNHSRFKNWERILMDIIADVNFCQCVFTVGTDRVTIYGTRHDSEMVIALYTFIRAQMINMANEAFRLSFSSTNGNTWKNSYFEGMNAKIRILIKDAKKTIVDQSGKNAIVLVKQEMVKVFFEENKGKTSKIQRTFNLASGAYRQGFIDGDKVALG